MMISAELCCPLWVS